MREGSAGGGAREVVDDDRGGEEEDDDRGGEEEDDERNEDAPRDGVGRGQVGCGPRSREAVDGDDREGEEEDVEKGEDMDSAARKVVAVADVPRGVAGGEREDCEAGNCEVVEEAHEGEREDRGSDEDRGCEAVSCEVVDNARGGEEEERGEDGADAPESDAVGEERRGAEVEAPAADAGALIGSASEEREDGGAESCEVVDDAREGEEEERGDDTSINSSNWL